VIWLGRSLALTPATRMLYMICIEYFSKQVEFIALPNKEPATTAAAFLSAVICRYGSPAQVVTDRGGEFQSDFQQLLTKCRIDHRTTSANHPQADGLAERAVQTLKSSLAKIIATKGTCDNWDLEMQWVALGYRCSKQKSTKLSPYQMLYGCPPCVPPAVREGFDDVILDFQNPEQAAVYLEQRAALLHRNCVMAMDNLRIAQHRDTLKYEKARTGTTPIPLVRFAVGDLVHVRRSNVLNTLQSEAKPGVFRIVQVMPSGVLRIGGRDGKTMAIHERNCSPCHQSNIDTTVDQSRRWVPKGLTCELCDTADNAGLILCCDGCGLGFHFYCLQLPELPVEHIWVCPSCSDKGISPMTIEMDRLRAQPTVVPVRDPFLNARQKLADEDALHLDGVQVYDRFNGSSQYELGTLQYLPRGKRKGRHPLRLLGPGSASRYLSLAQATELRSHSYLFWPYGPVLAVLW
jgi:hypothetical protein